MIPCLSGYQVVCSCIYMFVHGHGEEARSVTRGVEFSQIKRLCPVWTMYPQICKLITVKSPSTGDACI